MGPLLGIGFHAIGGLAAGSFYIPFRKVKGWSWEIYWLVNGFVAWVIVPWIVAFLTVPSLIDVLSGASRSSIAFSYLFGLLWGVGGLTFGLSMRYLGMSLGYALALGNCAAFGTVIPPIYYGTFGSLLTNASGVMTLIGVAVCLGGIAVCGYAGVRKEREMSDEQKREMIAEFNFKKGFWIALLCGVMSACFAFGIAAGKPIAELAVGMGTSPLFANSPVFLFIMAGGFTTNLCYCGYLAKKNGSWRDYSETSGVSRTTNVLFSSLAGIIWYFQFMFYGMGTSKMGAYDFSSWSIHMAFIIIFSTLWGLMFREWKGAGRGTVFTVIAGLLILVVSTWIIGVGGFLAG